MTAYAAWPCDEKHEDDLLALRRVLKNKLQRDVYGTAPVIVDQICEYLHVLVYVDAVSNQTDNRSGHKLMENAWCRSRAHRVARHIESYSISFGMSCVDRPHAEE